MKTLTNSFFKSDNDKLKNNALIRYSSLKLDQKPNLDLNLDYKSNLNVSSNFLN